MRVGGREDLERLNDLPPNRDLASAVPVEKPRSMRETVNKVKKISRTVVVCLQNAMGDFLFVKGWDEVKNMVVVVERD